MKRRPQLFYHAPCFDGFVSAALAWDYLDSAKGWHDVRLQPVDYRVRNRWVSLIRASHVAIVDFMYHPRAEFWADHHPTTFLTPALEKQFCRRKSANLMFDPAQGSCAELLWDQLRKRFNHRNTHFAEMVKWAAKIDAARYHSVEEAIRAETPALQLSLAMTSDWDDSLSRKVVHWLREESLAETVTHAEIAKRVRRALSRTELGLKKFKKAARIQDDIVVFDVAAGNTVVSRYAPYYFFPKARYSAGIFRQPGQAKISVMRNPWRDFKSVYLGRILKNVGGGGHERVASVLLTGKRTREAQELLGRVVGEIKQQEARQRNGHDRTPQLL